MYVIEGRRQTTLMNQSKCYEYLSNLFFSQDAQVYNLSDYSGS